MNQNNSDLLGPGTDLMISLLGVLLMSIAINGKIHENEQEYLTRIKDYQEEIIEEIIEEFPDCRLKVDSNRANFFLYIDTQDTLHDIHIYNDVTLQKISFGEQILFNKGGTKVLGDGVKIIEKFQKAILPKLDYIEEINIQGHTDRDGGSYENYKLGFDRSIAVYDNLKLSPILHLISITSFGEFKPEGRMESQLKFSADELKLLNNTEDLKKKNRRIDIVLNYRENFEAIENQ